MLFHEAKNSIIADNSEMKKCRARFGLNQTDKWCKHCKRKKKCLWFREGSGGGGGGGGGSQGGPGSAADGGSTPDDALSPPAQVSSTTHGSPLPVKEEEDRGPEDAEAADSSGAESDDYDTDMSDRDENRPTPNNRPPPPTAHTTPLRAPARLLAPV